MYNNEKGKRIPNIVSNSDESSGEHLGIREEVAGGIVPYRRPEHEAKNADVWGIAEVESMRRFPVQIPMGKNSLKQCNIFQGITPKLQGGGGGGGGGGTCN